MSFYAGQFRQWKENNSGNLNQPNCTSYQLHFPFLCTYQFTSYLVYYKRIWFIFIDNGNQCIRYFNWLIVCALNKHDEIKGLLVTCMFNKNNMTILKICARGKNPLPYVLFYVYSNLMLRIIVISFFFLYWSNLFD